MSSSVGCCHVREEASPAQQHEATASEMAALPPLSWLIVTMAFASPLDRATAQLALMGWRKAKST